MSRRYGSTGRVLCKKTRQAARETHISLAQGHDSLIILEGSWVVVSCKRGYKSPSMGKLPMNLPVGPGKQGCKYLNWGGKSEGLGFRV